MGSLETESEIKVACGVYLGETPLDEREGEARRGRLWLQMWLPLAGAERAWPSRMLPKEGKWAGLCGLASASHCSTPPLPGGANFGCVYFLGPRTIPSEGCSCELSAVTSQQPGRDQGSRERTWVKTHDLPHCIHIGIPPHPPHHIQLQAHFFLLNVLW